MKDKYLELFSCCFLSKGFSRSIIVDTQRFEFHFIPNELYEILVVDAKLPFTDILKKYGEENEEIINEYVLFLLEKELAFFTNEPKAFPKISEDVISPRLISNAIIDIGEESTYDISNTIKELDDLNCEGLQIRIFCAKNEDFYVALTKMLLETQQLKTIEMIIPFNEVFSKQKYYQFILQNCILINRLVIFNSPSTKEIYKEIGSILFTECVIKDESHCGNISKEYFATAIGSVVESTKYNSCLYKKISVDRFGNIKNCPSMMQTFGQAGKSPMRDILKNKAFTNIWKINKDQIKVCQYCEFRSICTDCRAYIKNPLDMYSKPLKCDYNPYTALWES